MRMQGVRTMMAVAVAMCAGVVGAQAAFGAKQKRGAEYVGGVMKTSLRIFPISFKVSGDGRHASNFTLNFGYPVYCKGAGFPILGASKAAAISRNATFTAVVPLLAPRTYKPSGSLIVTGTFGAHGKETGKVTTRLPRKFAKRCNGTSPYSTKVLMR
jgi:hypothetical protein